MMDSLNWSVSEMHGTDFYCLLRKGTGLASHKWAKKIQLQSVLVYRNFSQSLYIKIQHLTYAVFYICKFLKITELNCISMSIGKQNPVRVSKGWCWPRVHEDRWGTMETAPPQGRWDGHDWDFALRPSKHTCQQTLPVQKHYGTSFYKQLLTRWIRQRGRRRGRLGRTEEVRCSQHF